MKTFSKRLAVCIVVLVLAVGSAVGGVLAYKAIEPQPDYTMMVVSDTHVFLDKHIGNRAEDYQAFDAMRAGRLVHFSETIFENTLNLVMEEKPDALIVPGDLSDVATKETHIRIAEYFKEVEANGTEVFVVPGNHDIGVPGLGVSFENDVEEQIETVDYDGFAEIYADFGYAQAIDRHEGSISYAADMGEMYRIISVDAQRARESEKLSDDLIEWTVAAINKTFEDGRIPVAMSHYSLVSHYGEILTNFTAEKASANDMDYFREAIMASGLEYWFSGHMHASDIASYTNKNGQTIYDIETASLPGYPAPIRKVEMFGDVFKLSTQYLNKIDEATLPDFLTEEEREGLTQDTTNYLKKCIEIDMMDNIKVRYLEQVSTMLVGAFDIDVTSEEGAELCADFEQFVLDLMEMPLYDKDAEKGEKTLESVCAKYGQKLPAIDEKTVGELIFGFVARMFAGDESCPKGSNMDKVLRFAVYGALDGLFVDLDLFGRLHEINPDVQETDFSETMPKLFETGDLDLVDNELIGNVLKSVPAVKDSPIAGIVNQSSADILKSLSAILAMIELYDINVGEIIDGENGDLKFGAIFDLAMSSLADGIINDFSVEDNNVVLGEEE